jgi:alcohol dehydrogenase
VTRHGVHRAPAEILFGYGTVAALASATAELGRRVLVCSDPNILVQPAVGAALGELERSSTSVTVFDAIEPDLPLGIVEEILSVVAGSGVDVVVGLGGGSCMDAAKLAALLLRHPAPVQDYYGENAVPGPGLPVVAVPTTAGTGSEVTPVAVISDPDRHLKVGVSSPHLIPRVAICDPELTLSCPRSVTAVSGIDALAHGVEAYASRPRARAWEVHPGEVFQGKTVFSDRYALEAIEAIGGALERAVTDGSDREARERMLYGSLCAGLAFGNAGTAGAHALQYPIGALTGTPHGLGVGLLLPYVLRYTAVACEAELAQIAGALGLADRSAAAAVAEITRLTAAVGIPRTLAEIGISEAALPEIARQAFTVKRLAENSPRVLDVPALEAILRDAWSG